ncbi:MAG: hypothetical protein VKN72_03900 [Nostocales cyanobacterium 94392]|nr:hypothetical protein [Nostocales cyanobacterium 94392]
MLQIETIENLTGFGDKNSPGEYYHSENLIQGQFGLEANIAITTESATGSPARFNWFTEYGSTPYAVDTSGKIFSRSTSWSEARNPGSSSGNGLITDQKGRLLYARNQYLGMYNGTWNDTWKDFVTSTTEFRPMDTYEDWVAIGNKNTISLLNVTDDSFSADSLTLPTDFVVRAIKSNQSGILVGANVGGRSVIFLWDARATRSISDWIWFEYKLQSICKYGSRWIVTNQKQQFITDGYSTTALPSFPDVSERTETFRCIPAGTMVLGDKLFTANTDINLSLNRLKSGLWMQDLTNGLFNFVTVENGCVTDMTMGALYKDSSFNIFISYSTNLPSGNHVGQIKNTSPTSATLIFPKLGQGTNYKVAKGAKLDISSIFKTNLVYPSGSFVVDLKIYNFKRPLWGFGTTRSASSNTNELNVDGTAGGSNNAKIGDEVTILSGINAGQIRHITSISGAGTSTEIWTLNSALPQLTDNGAVFNVQPFQLVASKTISFSDYGELRDVYFDIRNNIKGKKFLLKIIIKSISNISLAANSLSFIYEDLGVL